MKINITLDLSDMADDNGSLTAEFQNQIVQRLIQTIQNQVAPQTKESLAKRVDDWVTDNFQKIMENTKVKIPKSEGFGYNNEYLDVSMKEAIEREIQLRMNDFFKNDNNYRYGNNRKYGVNEAIALMVEQSLNNKKSEISRLADNAINEMKKAVLEDHNKKIADALSKLIKN